MKLIVLALLLSLAICFQNQEKRSVVALNWSNCDASENDITVTKIEADAPIHKGTNNFYLYATANTYVSFEKIQVTTFYLGTQVDQRSFEYTEEYESGQSFKYVLSQDVPIIAPPGSYYIIINFVESDETYANCAKVPFNL